MIWTEEGKSKESQKQTLIYISLSATSVLLKLPHFPLLFSFSQWSSLFFLKLLRPKAKKKKKHFFCTFVGGLKLEVLMAENERYDRDNHLTLTGTTTASFSHLLFAEEDDSLATLDVSQIFKCGSSGNFPAEKNPKMLCFGDYPNNGDQLIFSKTTRASQKSGLTCSDSSSSASSTNSVISTMSKSINVVGVYICNLYIFASFFPFGEILNRWLHALAEKAKPRIGPVHQHRHHNKCSG